ncbi:MAG: phosphatidylserine decarboxylase [Candidatus Thermoplasmatota archaeon]
MKLAEGCKKWVLLPLILSIVFTFLTVISFVFIISFVLLFFTVLFWLLTFSLVVFFRDPTRAIGEYIVSAADGKIQEIKKINDQEEYIRISTFMNIFDVHVNRMPLSGVVKEIKHVSGGYLPAFKKESSRNERVIIKIDTHIGMIKLVQIAGTLARRIVSYVQEGDKVEKGERIGIIRFGSRVDLYLPSKKIEKLFVEKNYRVKAGVDDVAKIYD